MMWFLDFVGNLTSQAHLAQAFYTARNASASPAQFTPTQKNITEQRATECVQRKHPAKLSIQLNG